GHQKAGAETGNEERSRLVSWIHAFLIRFQSAGMQPIRLPLQRELRMRNGATGSSNAAAAGPRGQGERSGSWTNECGTSKSERNGSEMRIGISWCLIG